MNEEPIKVKVVPSVYIRTFDKDLYIIQNKTTDEIHQAIQNQEYIRMPNGDYVYRKSIKTIQSKESYIFQEDARDRQSHGQYLRDGAWYDREGYVSKALPQGEKIEFLLGEEKPKEEQKTIERRSGGGMKAIGDYLSKK